MRKLIAVFCAAMTALCCLAAPVSAVTEQQADLWVSPEGSDLNDGSSASPLKTVNAAKEKCKELKAAYAGATVHFAAGVYPVTELLSFTADDMPYVTYKGEGNVRFSGSYALSGFTEETVNGVRVFTKEVGTDAEFKSLFNGEKQLTQPRYPEEGTFTVRATDPANDLWTESNAPWSLCYGQRSFFADPKDVSTGFKNLSDVVVRILHYWHDEMMNVTSLDPVTGRIGLSRPSTMLIRDIDRYYFENVFEALNEPGEWYLDKQTGKLYYVPEEGETPETTVLQASETERLIDISGVNGIRFENIRFENTDWNVTDVKNSAWWSDWRTENNIDSPQAAFDVKGVITVNYAEDIAFRNCEFVNLGATAVKFVNGVKNSSVENCYFGNIAATGIFVGGTNCLPGEAGYTQNITVRNNEISGYGRKFFCAIGIQITYCDTAAVENNEIHDGFYTGISDGWVWGYAYQQTRNISIKNNLIYNIGQGWLSDMGGIYTLGIQPGTVLSGNVIHDVAADPGEGGYGGWGIYLDEGSSEMLVENNLVFACGSDGYHLHYGADNTVRNNIFALNANSGMRTVSKNEGHKTADITGNIILADGGTPVFSYVYDNGSTLIKDNYLWTLTEKADPLILNGSDFKKGMDPVTAKRKGFAEENYTADPGFKDARALDFTFTESSEAVALGFVPWDYTEAGTLAGTVLGLDREGGKTPYNADSAARDYTPAKERMPFFNEIANALVAFFARVTAFFRKVFGR